MPRAHIGDHERAGNVTGEHDNPPDVRSIPVAVASEGEGQIRQDREVTAWNPSRYPPSGTTTDSSPSKSSAPSSAPLSAPCGTGANAALDHGGLDSTAAAGSTSRWPRYAASCGRPRAPRP